MGPDLVVLSAPALDQDLGLGQGGADLRIETLVAQRAGEGFHLAVLPGAARLDAERRHAAAPQPAPDRRGRERGAVVGAEGGRRAALDEARRQPGEDVVGAQAPGDGAAGGGAGPSPASTPAARPARSS